MNILTVILGLLISTLCFAGDFVKPFAIYKVSYNETNYSAGVVGTAFFVAKDEIISAYHVINPELFMPNVKRGKTRIFLLNESHAPIELKDVEIHSQPNLDMVRVRFSGEQVSESFVYQQSDDVAASEPVTSEGYVVGRGKVKLNRNYFPESFHLPYMSQTGFISLFDTVNVKSETIRLSGVNALRLALPVWVGMSGGPLIQYGRAIAFNSFGLPANESKKTTAWAIRLSQ